jgi:TPR repeat protein
MAAAYYQTAADTSLSSMAYWNLGWMYENGIGVKRDWWLAKRSYDLAGDMGGKLPVMLSLAKLYVRRYVHSLPLCLTIRISSSTYCAQLPRTSLRLLTHLSPT